MEIYLLRSGETTGPHNEAEVRERLNRGDVGATDLAWMEGMEEWVELHRLLGSETAGEAAGSADGGENAGQTEPDEAPKFSGRTEEAGGGAPATEKQKAFLAFMGVQVEADLSLEGAAEWINRASLDPANQERRNLWNTERFRLHPELFAEEIQARKEERPAKYLEAVEKHGGAYFQKVTKAHCQVLLNHLDVQHPGWEQGAEALKSYFFPALEEKFAELVLPAGRGKFRYPNQAGRAGAGAGQKTDRPGISKGPMVKRDTPVRALVRGVIYGGLVLALLHGGQMGWSALQTAAKRQAAKSPAASSAGGGASAGPQKESAGAALAAVAPPESKEKKAGDLGSLIVEGTREAPMVAAASKPEMMAPESAPMPKKKRVETPEMNPSESLLKEQKVAPPPVKDPKSEATLLKPMTASFPFGSANIEAGTVLKVISKNGTLLKLRYGPDSVTVQMDQTDYAAREAGTVSKPDEKPGEKPPVSGGMKPGAGAKPGAKPGGALF